MALGGYERLSFSSRLTLCLLLLCLHFFFQSRLHSVAWIGDTDALEVHIDKSLNVNVQHPNVCLSSYAEGEGEGKRKRGEDKGGDKGRERDIHMDNVSLTL